MLSLFPMTAYAVFNDLTGFVVGIPVNQGEWDFTPNAPDLATGMNPVYWDGTTEIVKYTDSNLTVLNPNWVEEDWYFYRNTRDEIFDNKWANAKTKDGSFWVWIPRFVYVVRTNFHSSTTGIIDVSFVEGTEDLTFFQNLVDSNLASAANETWTSHPSFTFGSTQLTGFWVSKFLANNNSGVPRFMPGLTTWDQITIEGAFNEGRSIENESVFGLTNTEIESMLIRNDQLMAVSTLSFSKYGRSNDLITPPSIVTSGGGAGNFWTTEDGLAQSSTNNVHGVYDVGGAEYVPVFSNRSGLPASVVTNSYNANPGLFAHRFEGYTDTQNFKGHGFWEFAGGTIFRSYTTENNHTDGVTAWGGQQAGFAGFSSNTSTTGFYRDYVYRVGQFGFGQALNFAYTSLRFRASIVVL